MREHPRPDWLELFAWLSNVERAEGIKGSEWRCPSCGEELQALGVRGPRGGHAEACGLRALLERCHRALDEEVKGEGET